MWQKLPQTTLVGTRTDSEAKADVAAAEAAAGKIEPRFKLTKFVLSGYRRIDSRSDEERSEAANPMRELMRKVGLT